MDSLVDVVTDSRPDSLVNLLLDCRVDMLSCSSDDRVDCLAFKVVPSFSFE